MAPRVFISSRPVTVDFRCCLASLFTIVALSAVTDAQGTPRVVFTVDVESGNNFPLPQQVDAVCQSGSACGLMEIARMLKDRGLAGTFFLNVYEHQKWGEAALRDIVSKLQAAGQDVALHTHPQWTYDPARTGMHQYSLDDQTSIIREGVQLLSAWTGRPVVAHRAGDYAADERTLKALEANGLRIDSSLFWGHSHCRLSELGLPRNLPASWGKLIEIPVTVYQRQERPRLFGEITPPLVSTRKIDADWFVDEEEARSALDAVIEADLPFLVVFLHSFSLLAGRGSDGVPVADRQTQAIFRAILDRVTEKRLTVVTMRDLAELKEVVPTPLAQDVVPQVSVHVSLHRHLWHRLRSTEAGPRAAAGVAMAFFAAGAVVIAARRWKR